VIHTTYEIIKTAKIQETDRFYLDLKSVLASDKVLFEKTSLLAHDMLPFIH